MSRFGVSMPWENRDQSYVTQDPRDRIHAAKARDPPLMMSPTIGMAT